MSCSSSIRRSNRHHPSGKGRQCRSFKSQDRTGNSTDRPGLHNRATHEIGSEPSKDEGWPTHLGRDDDHRASRRRGPPFSYKPCAWAVTDHEAGPPYKPCAWTVTDHVMDINSSVRLASALAEPCTASSEHIRSLCSNARPCGAQRRTRAAIASTSLVEEHRRTLFGF